MNAENRRQRTDDAPLPTSHSGDNQNAGEHDGRRSRKRRRRGSNKQHDRLRDVRAEADPEDGIDPRILFRNHYREECGDGGRDHKLEQLSAQARRALEFVFRELHDSVVRELVIRAVEAAPDSRRLRVTVSPAFPDGSCRPSRGQIEERLKSVRGVLRGAVASSIRRKRAPELTFVVAPHEAGDV